MTLINDLNHIDLQLLTIARTLIDHLEPIKQDEKPVFVKTIHTLRAYTKLINTIMNAHRDGNVNIQKQRDTISNLTRNTFDALDKVMSIMEHMDTIDNEQNDIRISKVISESLNKWSLDHLLGN